METRRAQIRPLTVEDVPVLNDLIAALNAALGMPLAEESDGVEAALKGPNPFLFGYLLEQDGESIGYALCQPFFDTDTSRMATWLLDLYVAPERRGRGYGKALIARVAADATAKGQPLVGLVVYEDNPAKGLYERLGGALDKPAQAMEFRGKALDRLAQDGHL